MQKFIERWKSLGRENADYQKFWLELIQIFCGVEFPTSFLEFQVPVEFENSKRFIDVWIPSTKIIIEQKSLNKKLDVPEKQSGGAFLTPFEQAKRYDNARAVDQKANWIITSNFNEIWIYNLRFERPENSVVKVSLKEIPNFDWSFLTNPKRAEIYSEELISSAAGSLVQNFRDLFLNTKLTDLEMISLNRFCIQLVFCLYAEDSGLFKKRQFLDYLESLKYKYLPTEFKKYFERLFKRLDTENLPDLVDEILAAFPYVDGELFKGATLEIIDRIQNESNLDQILRTLINASANFNWNSISPTIFGSIFESIMNPETKHAGGIHYTSPENIHKVIDPLFLDELNREFESGENLEALHDKIANLKFFDPACGSGNFLTETFISLRKLEDRIIEKIGGSIRVSIENFYGIEINDWAVQVAKLALWISEHQMNGGDHFLPLNRNANIIEGNSLEIDWKSVIPNADFIMGNPPYIGARIMSKDQKSELQKVFDGWKNLGNLDYVACWFKKASDYIRDSKAEVGFVSTNSICQGDSVGTLWKPFFDDGIKINFARSTFKWTNESPDKKSMAQVHCVIVGFARFDRKIKLLDGIEVENINGYLRDASNVCIVRSEDSLCHMPEICMASMPNDDGNLIIEAEDLDEFIQKDPRSKIFIRQIIGAREYINNIPRYCLWLVDAEPSEIKSIKPIYERVESCRKYRLASRRLATRKLADTPWLFGEIRQPTDGKYLIIPIVSSERRKYIPMGFLNFDVIANASALIIPNADLYLFGILTSSVHMIWMRAVAGRLKSDYKYSAQIVYNNFPFPNHNPKIEVTAQKILDARSNHKNSSLAELYDPLLMPEDLQKAHNENDRAVIDAYGFPRSITESEIVSRLFEIYQELIRK
ncbi:MAG: SAM-dependent DNA methyltransferase [Selenomonadaceae bacterium]|nr:SAM-dependent DNA methyltransferase [Selenomonadaceae bacterium]